MVIWRRPEDVDSALDEIARVPWPRRVLMADPRDFDVEYAINPHMRDEGGALRRVDRRRAREQWSAVRDAFERLGCAVTVAAPLDGHPDLVFCANPALPVARELSAEGRAVALASNMRWRQRRAETRWIGAALRELGYATRSLHTTSPFEGMGDGLWHPGRALLWAGVGPRSRLAAWREVALLVRAPLALLRLVDPSLYHLDTALALLDERTCLWTPHAFDARSRALIERIVPRRIEADREEARTLLACNAVCPDGRHVLLQRGCERTVRRLRAAGYEIVELDTDEFLKSGGSVFCMKLALW